MDLIVLANEVHERAVANFKVSERFAYAFIMDVKKIRDERLYKELGYSSFDDYCEVSWNIKRDYMDQRIQIADSFGEENFADTYRQFGHSKSLLLARMEPEIRQKIEATVQVDETSVKRLKEIEKALHEAERRAATAEATAAAEKNSARHFEKLFDSVKNQPPRIETKIIERTPEMVHKRLEQLEFENKNLRHGYTEAKEKLQGYELREGEYDAEQAQRELERLQKEADISTVELRIAFKNFIEKAAITGYLQGAIATASPVEKDRLAELVESAQQILDQTKMALKGRRLGVVNE